jgi:hypothetical protein
MEIKEKHLLELFLGLVFVGLLLIAAVLVIYFPDSKSTSNVVQSYNSNSFNNYYGDSGEIEKKDFVKINYVEPTYTKIYDKEDNDYRHKYYENPYKRDYGNKDRNYLQYSSWGEREHDKDVFSNYRDKFRVHVVNKDYQAGYFKVRFYFCDYYGNCFTKTIQKYIPAKESRVFEYFDLQKEKFKYYGWKYDVLPGKVDKK